MTPLYHELSLSVKFRTLSFVIMESRRIGTIESSNFDALPAE